jgi:transcriptional regulator with XRE-family HTH domain
MHDRKIIDDRMTTLGLSLAQVAAYTGIGTSRLSPWLSEQRNLPAPVTQHVYQTLVALEKLQLAVGEDIPLDFRQIAKIKELLERLRRDEIAAVASR